MNKTTIVVASAVAVATVGVATWAVHGDDSPSKLAEQQAKQRVLTSITAVVAATGRQTKLPLKVWLSSCDDVSVSAHSGEYRVSTGGQIGVATADDATQLVGKVRDFFKADGYTKLTYESDPTVVSVNAQKDGVGLGMAYYPKSLNQEIQITGGTDCVVAPDGSDTPQVSSSAS